MATNKKKSKKKTMKPEVAKERAYDFYLMLEQKVGANEVINALKERGLSGLDVWESMGVFNIEAQAGCDVDFEEINIEETFVNASDLSFIKNRKIQSIFAFQATDAKVELLKPYFKHMTEIFGGFVCSDSDDFQPMVEF